MSRISVNKQLIVPYSAKQMFDLVNDIERYPEFLDWCNQSIIKSQDDDSITAEIILKYSGLSSSFTTCNILESNGSNYKIKMNLVDGPFQYLQGIWSFVNLTSEDQNISGSLVQLDLEFEFNNFMMGIAFNKVFQAITEKMVNKFYARAAEVYGK